MTSRTWFITGASSGLGRACAEAALDAGDRVVAAARSIDSAGLDGDPARLLRLPLDVRRRDDVMAAFTTARARFGRLDVVVNNAGTMASGFVEEFTEAQAREQFETNFFGAFWVTQAALRTLREQSGGHLVQMSSIGGVGGFAMTGLYSASKFAFEGLSEASAEEIAPFGGRVTIVEPGGYWTDLYRRMQIADPMGAYDSARQGLAEQAAESSVDSDPALAATAIRRLVDSPDPPLRLILGSAVFDAALDLMDRRTRTWREWEDVSRAAESAIPEPAGDRP